MARRKKTKTIKSEFQLELPFIEYLRSESDPIQERCKQTVDMFTGRVDNKHAQLKKQSH